MTAREYVRVCRRHREPLVVDELRDRLLCPRGHVARRFDVVNCYGRVVYRDIEGPNGTIVSREWTRGPRPGMKAAWADPERRARIVAAQKAGWARRRQAQEGK